MGIIKKICLLLIFWTNTILSAQQYEIVYELNYKPNVDKDSLVTEDFNLLINITKQVSFFENTGRQKIKDFYKEIDKQFQLGDTNIDFGSMPNYDFAYAVYKDFTNQNNVFYDYTLGKIYMYEYKSNFDWKIEDSVQDIMGYKCQKASVNFGDREWIAWFTTEIPISDGPYKFRGLPGLILKVSSIDNDYTFKSKEIYNTQKEIYKPNNVIELSENKLEDYKKTLKEKPSIALKNILSDTNSASVSVSFNGRAISDRKLLESYNNDVLEWIENHNNPIEKSKIWLKRE